MTRRRRELPPLLPGVPQRVTMGVCPDCGHWVRVPCVACRTRLAIEMGSVKRRRDYGLQPPELDLGPDEQAVYDDFWAGR